MKGTTNAQQNAVVDSSNTGDELTLKYADGTSKKHDLKTSITVDSSLSSTSTNPVENKAVQAALDNKQGKLNDAQMNAVNSGITATLVQKYNDMVSSGGEPNVIETVKVNNSELPVSGKAVNIDLSGYATTAQLDNKLDKTTASTTYATQDDLDKKIGNVYTKTEVDSKVSSVYRYKSSCTYANLPTSNNTVGDVYNVTDAHDNVPAGTNYAWNGTGWDALAGTVDLSPYAKSSDVYSKTTADSTFYKKTDTVANATKATQDGSGNVITSTYATKTEVNGKQGTLTTAQMSAVDSGITAAKVSTYDGYQASIDGKQAKLTFDTEPKSGSTNPVTSGGVYNAINNIQTVQFTLKVKYTGANDLSGISVTATPTGGEAGTVQGTTDASGVVYLTVRQNVTYTITSSKTNYVFGSSPTVACADLTTEVPISCSVKPKVTVTVVDSSNAGLQSGRQVRMSGPGGTQTKTTGSDGKVEFYADSTGEYTFSVTNVPDKATVEEVKRTLASNDDVSVELVISFGYGFVAVTIPTGTNSALTGNYPEKITVDGKLVDNGCYGFTPAKGAAGGFDMGSWAGHKLLEGIKPVSKDRSTWADLGTDASEWATNASTQDYFTEFPFQWLSITKSGNGITIIFSDSDTRPDETFQCYAHAKGCDDYSNSEIDNACGSASRDAIMESNNNDYFANSFHVGCFGASGTSSGIYSKKSTTYATSIAYADFWKGANARGADYDCMSAQQWTYIQALFLLLYCNKDSQTAHSRGLADAPLKDASNAALSTTAYGMAGGTTSARNAFFWIHDIWGNIYQFIGGMWNRAGSSSLLYYWLPRQANSRAFNNGWSAASIQATQANLGDDVGTTCSNSSGYISDVVGTNQGGFFPTAQSGSSTTAWPDRGYVDYYSSFAYFPCVGGRYDRAGNAGLFYCRVDNNSTSSYSDYGARLSYRGGRPKA